MEWENRTGQTEHLRLPWQHGGLSVVNPLEKSRALKLRWVPPVGDSTCEKKWVYFARYWIGFSLSHRMKSWAFLRSNKVPKHLWDDKPPIYQAVLTAVDRIGVDFDLLSDQCQDLLFKAHPSSSPAAALRSPVGTEVRLLLQLG